MNMKKYLTVTEYLEDLSADKLAEVAMLREMILSINPALTEHIKWNAPSYVLEDTDRITFGMNKTGVTTLVLHMGAARKENTNAGPLLSDDRGLVEWKSDIRGVMTFNHIEEIAARSEDISYVLQQWLTQTV